MTTPQRRLASMGIRHLPVIEAGGRCLGVVAEAELVHCLAQGLGLPYSGWLRVGHLVRRVEPIPRPPGGPTRPGRCARTARTSFSSWTATACAESSP
jgi:hypothetical protein